MRAMRHLEQNSVEVSLQEKEEKDSKHSEEIVVTKNLLSKEKHWEHHK